MAPNGPGSRPRVRHPAPLARLHEGVDLGTRGHVVWSREGTRHGCLSVQVLQEFFVTTTWKLPRPLEAPAAAQIVDDLAHWHVHSPAVADVRAAIDIHQRTGASFWDAMILRSAQELGCQILYSEDLDAGQEYEGVEVRNPFPA